MRASAGATSCSMKARVRSRTASTSGGRVKPIAMGKTPRGAPPSALLRDLRRRQVDEALGHLVAGRHARVLRLALVPAEVELLYDDRHLEEAEGVVVGELAHVAAALPPVVRDR